jgi:phage tail protein X
MTIYIVKEEDERLDTVVYTHYGELTNIFTILELNPHVQRDVYLEVGAEIKLPYFTEKKIKEIQLWD